MTFFEAAVEVLRRTGRPLHFKKITEIALRDELLSHTGKAPDATMATRLTQELKSQGESVIVQTRPGVYSLRESEVERLNEEANKRLEREKARRRRRAQVDSAAQEVDEDEAEEKSEASGDAEPNRRRRSRRRTNRSSKSSRSTSSSKKSSRGKSRSKSSRSKSSRSSGSEKKSSGSKGNLREEEAAHTDDELDAQVNGNRKPSRRGARDKSASGGREQTEARSGARRRARGARRTQEAEVEAPSEETSSAQETAKPSRSSSSRSSSGSKPSRSSSASKSSRRRSRGRRSTRDERPAKSNGRQQSGRAAQVSTSGATRHLEAGPVRLDGIAHAAYTVLKDADKKGLEIQKLADEIFDRKLVKFHTHDAAATVQAALANDNQIRRRRGHRPLFIQHVGSRWGLSEWGLPDAAIQKEQAILSLSEEIRQDTLGHLGEALLGVKDEALEHIALTLLERLGYQNIKVSKRSSDGDVYFTADWRQGLADVRVCIQVTLEAEGELGEGAIGEIRETLHHYSAAEGVIIHLGDISKKAVGESRQDEKAPITLIDRGTFVELLIRHGIGVQAYTTPILMVDTEFIDTLKS